METLAKGKSNTSKTMSSGNKRKKSLLERMKPYTGMYLMLIPGMLLILVFCYGPMYGLQIAFKDYSMGVGILGSPWVGFKHFVRFLGKSEATNALRNTLLISVAKMIVGFPMPIILALLINEIGNKVFKKVSQTISYLPHFISWVIVAGLMNNIFSPSTGVINYFITSLGESPIHFLADPKYFRALLILTNIWKEVGWGSVVYLAALSSIDTSLYEAAIVDGASRVQRILYITLPSILPVASIMLILSMGSIMSAGFDQIFNLYSPIVYNVGDILDTYVYRIGMQEMSYSFSTAVGLFKSVVGLVLILTVNLIVKKVSPDSGGGLF